MNEKIHAHLRHKDGYKFEITFDELPGDRVLMDEPTPVGRSEGPSAAMMLSSAVGHCLTSSLLFCMQKSRGAIKEIEADVDTSLARNERGRWRVTEIKVRLKPTVDAVDREKLERCRGLFEDFCIVTASIREGVKVDVELEM
ncbi:MAG: hypothetical protein A3K60_00965 [Euryarchaeota archaeon RBG_19FT_COMBO_56_21]|nr:MAG: hypothetical protein A3K60_00965 [Euryarchaeota archaeon RBG_19FT_COMBO_56_21]